MEIKEVIVVEGRDDTNSIKRAVTADTIETHGFGIKAETWALINKAYNERGIILFTDPDYAGEQIRKRVLEKFPNCKEAFLDRESARAGTNIGVENAAPEDIRDALSKVHGKEQEEGEKSRDKNQDHPTFTMADMIENGLWGSDDSKEKRKKIGKALGIGYGNCRAFLSKLNNYNITKEEFHGALRKDNRKGNKEEEQF